MRVIMGLFVLAAASNPSSREPTGIAPPDHGESPGFIIPSSDFDQRTWTDDLARPPDSRSFDWCSSITTSRSSSVVVAQTIEPVTIIHPGTVSTSTVYLTSSIAWIETSTHDGPASPDISITVEKTVPALSTTYQQHRTIAYSLPACRSSGISPTSNAAVCNGKGCEITFGKGAIIHWELLTNRTPLVTHYLHRTCVAIVCNTTDFSLYYSRSATSCDRLPCPSNSLNCECNIVVGPVRLPDGRITSITQTGPSGWNLNLGPAATAHNIGHCGPDGLVCDAITTTIFTPLVYTDNVKAISTTAYRNDSKAKPTEFLLPQLTNYFPADDPLGMCTHVKLSLPPEPNGITKRDDIATVGGDGVTTWPGCETLTNDANARRDLMGRQINLMDVTHLPICSSNMALSTATVTATIHRGTGTASATYTQGRSVANRQGIESGYFVWLFTVLVMVW